MFAPLSHSEVRDPSLWTIPKLAWNVVAYLLSTRVGVVTATSIIALLLWGQYGSLDLLNLFVAGWKGPGSDPARRAHIVRSLPWDQEWISFILGVLLLVLVPLVVARLVLKRSPGAFGLRLPVKGKRRVAWLGAASLFLLAIVPFELSAGSESMRAIYPMYRGPLLAPRSFVTYEAGYSLFFIAIEFMFRGFLLLGIYEWCEAVRPRQDNYSAAHPTSGYIAIVIAMLSYTAWHLGKPLPELWGTIAWGVLAGSLVLTCGSIWPVTIVHWLLNVFLDWRILHTR